MRYSITKRTFIFIILAGLMNFVSSCQANQKENNATTTSEGAKASRPNILFIMSDDHAYQAISAYGSELSQLAPTPNIDRIAQNGALFTQMYNTNSICGPSRAVILTGKHSHMNGFRQNGERFDGNQPTLPKKLKSIGYQTVLIGKWHLYGYPQGFDYWNIVEDQGHYYNPDFIKMGDTIRIAGYATDIITEEALNWLEKNARQEKPFFMMLHHKAPHRNFMPALRYLNAFDSITFPVPDTYFDKHENQIAAQQQLQTIYKDMYEGHDLKLSKGYGSTNLANNPWTNDFDRMSTEQKTIWNKAYLEKNNAFWKADLKGKELAIWKFQRYLQEYLATVKAVDDGVGKVLDYLKESGLMENTIVVYTSDQGFYLGEHGWFDKRFMYEESFRTPLLIRYPKEIKKGTVIDKLVQNLDFAPTLLDYAGIEAPEEMQGDSFRKLVAGKTDEWRDFAYYTYYEYPAEHMVKRHYGVTTDRYKLIHFYYDIDEWELYDLETDPQELTNQYDNPEYAEVIEMMHKKLEEVRTHYGDSDELNDQYLQKFLDHRAGR